MNELLLIILTIIFSDKFVASHNFKNEHINTTMFLP